MEFIRGVPLTSYAESRHLSVADRLKLMVKVCDAVQHAHQRGVIHRDLKPGNILVDETGQPKVLDFGVARATDSDGSMTRQTDIGQLVGTLAYMSPEQVLADPLELDTRSDVYALGVVIYELLTGRLPYVVSGKLHEAVQTIRENDPAPLSSVSRLYRGDIETIVSKSLEKDKTRRYASAAELAADILRYLHDEPIAARSPSAVYQIRKFARRHKPFVVGAAAVAVVLVAGAVVSTWQAVLARRAEQVAIEERDRANREATTARQVTDFLVGLFNVSDPGEARGNTLTAGEILDSGAARVERDLTNQPEVQARLMATIGKVYTALGMYPSGQPLLERALATARTAFGDDHPQTLAILSQLASLHWYQDRFAEAERLYSEVVAARTRLFGAAHRETLQAAYDLATTYGQQKRWNDAETLVRATLDLQSRTLGESDADTLRSMSELSSNYYQQERYAEALPLEARATELRRSTLGVDHVDTLFGSHNLATIYERLGRYDEAESTFVETIDGKRRVFGAGHPTTALTTRRLARMYAGLKRYGEAESLLQTVFQAVSTAKEPDATSMNAVVTDLVALYDAWNKFAQAAQWRAKLPRETPANR